MSRLLMLTIGLLIGAVLVASIFIFDLLLVKQTTFLVVNAPCVSEAALKAEVNLEGTNIFLIEQANITQRLRNKFPCINQTKFEVHYPYKVSISVAGRDVLSRIATFKEKKLLDSQEASPSSSAASINWTVPEATPASYFLIDAEGLVYAQAEATGSSVIYVQEDLVVGKQLDKALFSKISLVFSRLRQLEDNIVWSKLTDNLFQIQANEKIVLDLNKEIFEEVASLQLILQKAKIDSQRFEMIDLRFEKPIVIYSTKK